MRPACDRVYTAPRDGEHLIGIKVSRTRSPPPNVKNRADRPTAVPVSRQLRRSDVHIYRLVSVVEFKRPTYTLRTIYHVGLAVTRVVRQSADLQMINSMWRTRGKRSSGRGFSFPSSLDGDIKFQSCKRK